MGPLGIVGLMLLALMVPFAIFTPAEWNGLLFFIAIAIYFFIFYLVDSFCYYLTSNAPQKTQEAEESRQYFHTVFRQHTGITPTQYQQHGATVD